MSQTPVIKTVAKKFLYGAEQILGGSILRESILVRLLQHHYASRFRRDWWLSKEPPHFYNHRLGVFNFAFTDLGIGPYPYYRAFYGSEIIRDGDRLLDIGCGDGFFTKRFFGAKCGHIDALDVEPSAIEAARRYNSAPNINYFLQDATTQDFPQKTYDVIVWDGALGHFPPETTQRMLRRISDSLASDGIFIGSESLKHEGDDHLQFFESLEDLHKLFHPHFRHVELRSSTYGGGLKQKFVRDEAYWRCAQQRLRMDEVGWKQY